ERGGAKANPRPASPAEIDQLLRTIWWAASAGAASRRAAGSREVEDRGVRDGLQAVARCVRPDERDSEAGEVCTRVAPVQRAALVERVRRLLKRCGGRGVLGHVDELGILCLRPGLRRHLRREEIGTDRE